MPTPNPPAKDYLFNQIADLQARIKNLEQQPKVQTTSAYSATQISTSSSTLVALSPSPSFTATIGASGSCVVSCSSMMWSSTAGNQSVVWLFIDGNLNAAILQYQQPSTYGIATCGGFLQVTGLTPGNHGFSLRYNLSGGSGLVYFQNIFLGVQPI